MILYVIHREGVYRHECGGIFVTRETAEEVAEILIRGEPDNHHEYHVRAYQVGYPTPRDPNSFDGSLQETDILTRFKRKDKRIVETSGRVRYEVDEITKEVLG